MKTFPIEDFSGGWNPSAAWSEIADNESPDMINFSLDERGGIVKRLGLTKTGAQIVNTANVQSLYYSTTTDRLLAQVGASVYASSNGGSTWGAAIKTFSSAARCHMVDFIGKVVLIHPIDKVFTWDGTTFSAALANSPAGSCIAVWQNALWSIGDSAAPSRVTRSDLGALTYPGSPVTVDLRAKDDKALTCIGGGAGMDILGRDGVFVWKEDSRYRIFDSTTGEYTVEDYNYGASGPQAVTTNDGVTAAICRRGIVAIKGTDAAIVSTKIEPLFRDTQLSFGSAANMVAANHQNRIIFSMPWDGSSVNNLTLEFSPTQGWFAPHDFGLASATSYTKALGKLYGGKVGTDAATYGFVYNVFTGSSDDTVAITCRWQGRWFEPNKGNNCRFRRLNVNGRGTFSVNFKRDYDTGAGERFPINIAHNSAVWGTAVWGVDSWGSALFQDYDHIFSLGVGRSFSITVSETSSLSATGPTMLQTGAAETVGPVAVYGLNVDIQPLGNN